jgi:hypothetical protein
MEEFRTIEHLPNYEISNFGRMRNKTTKRIMKQQPNIDKYNNFRSYTITIKFNDIKTPYYIHRLVALAFIPNPENKPIVDHIDRHPENNHVSNLRWATFKENANNKNIQINNVSGETNVYYIKASKKWGIKFSNYDKSYYKGRYDTFEEAKKAKESGIFTFRETNTKQKYITYRNNDNKYQFSIQRHTIRHCKVLETLEEAVEYRDEFLKTL